MSRLLAVLLLVALVAALAVLLWMSRPQPVEPEPARLPGSGAGRPSRPATATSAAPPASSAAPVPEWPKQDLALWFEGDDSRLHRELRSVPVPPEPTGKLRAALSAMLAGPTSEEGVPNWPAGAAVRAVFLAPPGVVTVDLDIPPEALVGWGSHQEWFALQGLVATVLASSPEGIGGVVLTIRGEIPETLGGHVDLTRPIRLDPKLLAEEPLPAAGSSSAAPPSSSSVPPPAPPRTAAKPAAPAPDAAARV